MGNETLAERLRQWHAGWIVEDQPVTLCPAAWQALAKDLDEAADRLSGGPAGAVTPAMLDEACIIGLAVAGSLAPDGPDEWLANHEKRLRELEKVARSSATDRTA